jgi:hypothetical protein
VGKKNKPFTTTKVEAMVNEDTKYVSLLGGKATKIEENTQMKWDVMK